MKNLIKFLLKPLNPVDLEFVHATQGIHIIFMKELGL